jgi:methyl-accepting chemotaxis protein
MADRFASRRKQVVVERKIQFRFARFVVLFAIATSFLTSATVFFTTFSLLGDKLADVYPQGRLVAIFRTVYLAFALNLALAAPVLFYLSLRFTHRLAGPLPKIYDTLRKVGQGDFEQKLVLRRNDELRDLADVINEMIENLRSGKGGGRPVPPGAGTLPQ